MTYACVTCFCGHKHTQCCCRSTKRGLYHLDPRTVPAERPKDYVTPLVEFEFLMSSQGGGCLLAAVLGAVLVVSGMGRKCVVAMGCVLVYGVVFVCAMVSREMNREEDGRERMDGRARRRV